MNANPVATPRDGAAAPPIQGQVVDVSIRVATLRIVPPRRRPLPWRRLVGA
jgi:hypothetical protein